MTTPCTRISGAIAAMLLVSATAAAQSASPTPAPDATPDASPSPAATPTGEEKGLEEEIRKALEAEAAAKPKSAPLPAPVSGATAAASLNPDLAFVADVVLAGFSADEPLQTGGHDPRKNGFNLQQLEMTVGKAVDPYFRFDANLVFSPFGVEIEEAYATTLALPWSLQARVGQMLTRVGRVNPTHPHTWDFVDQTLAIGRLFGSEGNRGLGVEASWLTPLPWYVELVVSETDPAGEATARSFYGSEDLGIESPLDFQHTMAAKQFFPVTTDTSVLWGLTYTTGPNATGYRNRTEIYATDLYVKYRPISDPSNPTIVAFQTEWFYRRRQVPEDVLQDVNGYAYVFWRFRPRWGTALRWEYGSPSRNLDGDTGFDALDPEWVEDRHRVSSSLTFWPTEFSRVRLQAAADAPGWKDEPDYSAFLAFEFSVGAHGAHKF